MNKKLSEAERRTRDFLAKAARDIEQERNLKGEGKPAFRWTRLGFKPFDK